MTSHREQLPLLLLDACCLLNLFATRHIEHILRTLQHRFAIAVAVKTEARWVFEPGEGEDPPDRESVDVESLATAGLLDLLSPETDRENEDYVAFAVVLDDGEAMTAALAVHRGAQVATDDRVARRELRARAPQVAILSTSELLHAWSNEGHIEPPVLAQALRDVRTRARFLPPTSDPLRAWWDAACENS